MRKNKFSREQITLQSLVNSAHEFLKSQDFKQSTRFAYDCCKNLLGSTAGYVALLSADKSQNELLFLDMGDLPCALNQDQPMPIRGFRANAYSSGKVVYENNFQQSEWLQYLPDGHGMLDNVMFAPIVINNITVGIFGFANKPGGFNEDDALIASAFAEMTAIALLQNKTLERSETNARHLAALMQSAHDSIITVNQQGDIHFWNQAAEKTFGYSTEEVVGKSCRRIIPEHYKKIHDKAFARAVKTGIPKLEGQIIEVEALRKNSETFPAELSLSKWEIDDAVFFTMILRDITSRKKVKKESLEAKTRLREVFKRMKGGCGIYKAVDDGDDFVFIDHHRPEHQESQGKNENLQGKSILEVFPAIKEYGLFEIFQRVWKTGKPELHPVKIYDGDKITGWRENYVYKLPTGEIVALYEDFTERKKLEVALQESETLFRTIFETSPSPININRLNDGKFIEVNNKFLELTGFKKNEVIGKTALELNIWENIDEREKFFSELKSKGKVSDFEADFRSKDGSLLCAQVSAELISFQNEMHLLAVTKDITELKKVEKALQDANKQLQYKFEARDAELKKTKINYRIIADYTYDWEWWTNVDGAFRYVSPACERITGYKAQQFIENHSLFEQLLVPEDREKWDKHHKESHKGIGLREMQFRIKRLDGMICWIEHACQPVFSEEKKFLGFRASNRDITDRKYAEEALQESEINLKKAQEVAFIGSWNLDLLENNLIWSDENYRIFGIPKGTPMSYERFIEIVHPEDRDYVNEKWSAAVKGELYDIEHRLLINNEVKWVREKAELRFNEQGKPISGLGITQDITDRKLAEIARQETEEELRGLSAQLLSAEERERKRIASDIHDSIGQALSAIKFSVENSLSAIDEKSISSAIESLHNIIPLTQQSIEEVRRIIMDLRPSTLDDLGLIATISWFSREFESIYTDIRIEKEIHVKETEISPSLKTVIYRILQEALNNAAKHGQTDNIRLHLIMNKENLELMIEDTGVGFNPAEERSKSTAMKGMGLGSMKERAQLSGGNFSIRSTPGVGTRIIVSWPKKVCCADQNIKKDTT